MKNMKVAKKLILGFSIVAILCAVVGGVGIIGMWQINKAQTNMYDYQTKPLPDIAKILEYSQRLRIQLRNAALFTGNAERLKTVESDMLDREAKIESFIAAYDVTVTDPNARKLFDEAVSLYINEYKPAMDEVLAGAKAGMAQSDLIEIMDAAGSATNQMVDNFTECMNIKISAAEAADLSNDTLYTRLLTIIIIVIVIAVVASMVIALYISGMISKPLNVLTSFMNKAGTKGDISLRPEDVELISQISQRKDELGQCVGSTANFVKHMTDVSDSLGLVASGDLTAELVLLSEDDVMGISLSKMIDNLNSMFMDLKMSSDQVSSGAGQVSQGAQELASASSEQAASVQELSAAITQVREQVNENSKRSEKALENCNTAGNLMSKSVESMRQMLEAMIAIDESSKNITRVIKVIDDIAFQTNILALNAAVEAARAGQHGKGFAVVADEVRNLAAKSAEAAKETAHLIEGSSQRVSDGNKIVEQTNESLKAVEVTTEENAALIKDITKSLDVQTSSVVEINQGMDQISTVVQSNAATSEQSAAAAEEMAAQSVVMNEIVAHFKLKRGSRSDVTAASSLRSGKSTKSNDSGLSLFGSKY